MKGDNIWVSAVSMENTFVQMMSTDRTDLSWSVIIQTSMSSADDLAIEALAQPPLVHFNKLHFMSMGGDGNSFTNAVIAPVEPLALER